MANTTFSGPIRSEGGFEQVTKSSTTGAFTTNFDVDSSGNITDVGSITADGGSKTTTIAIPAATGSAFSAQLSLTGGTAANAVIDVAGDTFTFVASTVVGSTARIVCVSDNGTGQVWMAVGSGSPISTVA